MPAKNDTRRDEDIKDSKVRAKNVGDFGAGGKGKGAGGRAGSVGGGERKW